MSMDLSGIFNILDTNFCRFHIRTSDELWCSIGSTPQNRLWWTGTVVRG